jgi:Raf kinase inhibitor-like YbhB/YbcL family protein
MRLTSEAFLDYEEIPRHFTFDGEEVSPPLQWAEAPKSAKSFVVILKDLDARDGPRRHWACYDIPAYHTSVVEGCGRPGSYEDFRHAVNDLGNLGYNGPRPPHREKAHHYRFHLMALDCPELQIRTHPTCAEVETLARKHLISEATLIGRYAR